MDDGSNGGEPGGTEWLVAPESARSAVDPLTGLLPTGRTLRALDGELRAASAGLAVSLAFCDVDRLRQVNDSSGHRAGDQVLAGIAASFVRDARPDDIVTRYEGDEFLIVLFDADLGVATTWARAALAGLADDRGSAVVQEMTVSFGVATHDGREGVGQLFERADAAMYRAKQAGRNRVETAGAAVEPPTGRSQGDGI